MLFLIGSGIYLIGHILFLSQYLLQSVKNVRFRDTPQYLVRSVVGAIKSVPKAVPKSMSQYCTTNTSCGTFHPLYDIDAAHTSSPPPDWRVLGRERAVSSST